MPFKVLYPLPESK